FQIIDSQTQSQLFPYTTLFRSDVPRHIENAESRAVQKSRNHIFLIELVPGGKGEGVDTAEITVRRILDKLFDRAYRLRFRRLSQDRKSTRLNSSHQIISYAVFC